MIWRFVCASGLFVYGGIVTVELVAHMDTACGIQPSTGWLLFGVASAVGFMWLLCRDKEAQ